MHTILSSLMAAMLLIHAFVGCCRHAAHEAGCRDTSAACAMHATGGCGHEGANHGDELPSAPCNCRLDCKSVCIYLPPEMVVLDPSELVRAFDVTFVGADWTDASLVQTQSSWSRARDPGTLAPAPRLHLLYQILLI